MKTTGLLGALLVFAFAQAGRAADITYTITGETVGAGSVSGSITTDGNLGTLGSGDIVSWNLNINDGTGPFDLTTGNSEELVQGGDLTANPTQLIFNFNGDDGGFFAVENPTIGGDGPFIGYNAEGAFFDSSQSINISSEDGESTILQPTFTGNQVIAGDGVGTIVGGSAVPEPSSVSLLGLGLAGVLFAVSRSRRARASVIA